MARKKQKKKNNTRSAEALNIAVNNFATNRGIEKTLLQNLVNEIISAASGGGDLTSLENRVSQVEGEVQTISNLGRYEVDTLSEAGHSQNISSTLVDLEVPGTATTDVGSIVIKAANNTDFTFSEAGVYDISLKLHASHVGGGDNSVLKVTAYFDGVEVRNSTTSAYIVDASNQDLTFNKLAFEVTAADINKVLTIRCLEEGGGAIDIANTLNSAGVTLTIVQRSRL